MQLLRYASALCINVLLPWLAYRLASPHWGQPGGLLLSTVPLIAWMTWDLARHRHFDALSAIVLIGIVLSLAAMELTGASHNLALDEPMVSGMIGVAFLASLVLPRPMVFYTARSTLARESVKRVSEFEQEWRERPKLVYRIRIMTLVWGIGLITENALRTLIVWGAESDPHSVVESNVLRYGCYGGLMLWTIWYRRRIKHDAEGYANKAESTIVP